MIRDKESLIMWYIQMWLYSDNCKNIVTEALETAQELFYVLSILCILQYCLDLYIAIFNQLQ